MILTRTPFRISLFGGGTDYPEWFQKKEGQIISLAINKYCYVTVRYLPPYFDYNYRIRFFYEQKAKNINEISNPVVRESLKYYEFKNNKIEIVHHADLPGLSGLGGSSAFAVGILNALNRLKNKNISKKQLANQAINLERNIIGDKVGYQDQIIAAYGGFRSVKFLKSGNYSVNSIKLNDQKINYIENNFILIYTGLQRFSKDITSILSKKTLDNKNTKHLSEMAEATIEAEKILNAKKLDLKQLSDIMNYQWSRKKELAEGITNKKIEKIYNLGLSSGAEGGKLLGAGGGGFILFIVPNKNLVKFKKNFIKFMSVKVKVDNVGSDILYNSSTI
jgi:D-glycero-alpha-D-manno-heptose-7-phosphate kinase